MFNLVIPGRPCMTDMVIVSPTQSMFNIPTTPHFSHIVIFMSSGSVLPDGTAAAVHLRLSDDAPFQFLGAVANEKPSAIFKVNLPASNGSSGQNGMNLQQQQQQPVLPQSSITLGISIEPIPAIQVQLNQLKEQQQQSNSSNPTSNPSESMALTIAKKQPTTKLLAQRIIQNAFNFLASFAGNLGPGGQEVVPLKSFEEWWKKFERRIENDPGFLERDS